MGLLLDAQNLSIRVPRFIQPLYNSFKSFLPPDATNSIERAVKSDEGNYTCVPANLDAPSVRLHVVSGKSRSLKGEGGKCLNRQRFRPVQFLRIYQLKILVLVKNGGPPKRYTR